MGEVAGAIHVDKPKRRSKLTINDRLQHMDKVIDRLKLKLKQAENKRLMIITQAREEIRKRAAEIENLK